MQICLLGLLSGRMKSARGENGGPGGHRRRGRGGRGDHGRRRRVGRRRGDGRRGGKRRRDGHNMSARTEARAWTLRDRRQPGVRRDRPVCRRITRRGAHVAPDVEGPPGRTRRWKRRKETVRSIGTRVPGLCFPWFHSRSVCPFAFTRGLPLPVGTRTHGMRLVCETCRQPPVLR